MTGISPYLMHGDSLDFADYLQRWRKDPTNKNLSVPGDDRAPAWSWHGALYNDGKTVCVPSANVMSALKSAGAQLIASGRRTFKQVSQSGMYFAEEYLAFEYGTPFRALAIEDINAMRDLPFHEQADACKALGFRLFVKRAIPQGKSRHVRVRPRFDTWRITGILTVTATELTHEVVSRLFDLAGNGGLGNWRPTCKSPGPFGRFTAECTKG
jgi:hypothetical protein